MSRSVACLCFGVLLACQDNVGPVEGVIGGRLAVRAAALDLELTNQSPAPIYYLTLGLGSVGFTLAPLCTDPSRCTAIQAGQTASVPYAQIPGYTADTREAIVYWWHLIPGAQTGLRPDSVRTVIVGL